ncbi:hypothetical protein OEZ85_013716 [Tetradesmus obliquus]|uniref:Uncharacterized protein n=1 Tax=Tetradesmus obliquus TaxID=3088 RepID=A0ABY8URT2_TETOB|nr:hypothetical protein OEZ85_013716 [Tetradesmus obliquus]
MHNTSVPIAPEALDMETLIATSTQQQFKEHLVEASDQTHNQDNQQPQFTLAPTHIIPTLKLDGKPATVLPMEVLRTTWEGRDATDVAACLSEAIAHRLRVAQSNIVGMTTRSSTLRGGDLPDTHDDMLTTMELAVEVAHVKNEEHPELCAGIDGNSFRLRFAGFGGESSLPAASPNHIWVYVAVAEDVEQCGATE